MFCRKFITPSSFSKVEPVYNYDDYLYEMKNTFQRTWDIAQQKILESKQKSKLQYDKNVYSENIHVGDQVLLKNNASKNKLDTRWLGPYVVQSVEDNDNLIIDKNGKPYRTHINQTHKFF